MATFKIINKSDIDAVLQDSSEDTIFVVYPDSFPDKKKELLTATVAFAFPGNVTVETYEAHQEATEALSEAAEVTTEAVTQEAAPEPSTEAPVSSKRTKS